jgi:hypothetical protein
MDDLIKVGKTIGIRMEEFRDKWSIKSYTYWNREESWKPEFITKKIWNPDTRSKTDKTVPLSIYLGNREEAIIALHSLLEQLGGDSQEPGPSIPEDLDIPF